MSEMKARILGLPECLHHDGRRIWLANSAEKTTGLSES